MTTIKIHHPYMEYGFIEVEGLPADLCNEWGYDRGMTMDELLANLLGRIEAIAPVEGKRAASRATTGTARQSTASSTAELKEGDYVELEGELTENPNKDKDRGKSGATSINLKIIRVLNGSLPCEYITAQRWGLVDVPEKKGDTITLAGKLGSYVAKKSGKTYFTLQDMTRIDGVKDECDQPEDDVPF